MEGSASRITLPPSPAVAAVGAAAGDVLLTPEADAARAAVAALDEDIDLVDEHGVRGRPADGRVGSGGCCWAMLTYLSSPLRSKRT